MSFSKQHKIHSAVQTTQNALHAIQNTIPTTHAVQDTPYHM